MEIEQVGSEDIIVVLGPPLDQEQRAKNAEEFLSFIEAVKQAFQEEDLEK